MAPRDSHYRRQLSYAVIMSHRLLARGYNAWPAIFPGVAETRPRLRFLSQQSIVRSKSVPFWTVWQKKLAIIRGGPHFGYDRKTLMGAVSSECLWHSINPHPIFLLPPSSAHRLTAALREWSHVQKLNSSMNQRALSSFSNILITGASSGIGLGPCSAIGSTRSCAGVMGT